MSFYKLEDSGKSFMLTTFFLFFAIPAIITGKPTGEVQLIQNLVRSIFTPDGTFWTTHNENRVKGRFHHLTRLCSLLELEGAFEIKSITILVIGEIMRASEKIVGVTYDTRYCSDDGRLFTRRRKEKFILELANISDRI